MSEPICKCPFCNNDMFAVGDTDWGFTWIHDTPKSDCPLFTTMPNSVIFPSEKAIINAFSSRPIEDALRAENERLQAYATRLLFEDSRLWHCKKCGSEFSSFLRGQPEIPNAEIQCPICEDGVAVPKAWIMQDEIERLRDALELFMECPYVIDEASVPKGGIEKNPSQVVGVMSVSITKIRKARAALSSLLVKDGK